MWPRYMTGVCKNVGMSVKFQDRVQSSGKFSIGIFVLYL
ncbi:hypothetical protein SXCC_02620 [Gluconacetobacter sp. SXCC-1]|nr:hypothetical protein SXCC_02620 [Gluconacetobacter sp. SXCC-1]